MGGILSRPGAAEGEFRGRDIDLEYGSAPAGYRRFPGQGRPRTRLRLGSRGSRIDVSDLVIELRAVNWHELGVQLQVPLSKLEKIDEDYRLSERKLSEVLGYWLRNDRSPSWDKICEALQRIGGFGRLVRELRMKYCSLQICREQLTQGKGQFFARAFAEQSR